MFIESIGQAQEALSKPAKSTADKQASLEQCVTILSQVRNQAPSRDDSGHQGLILLDQFFAVPQVGEVIRDVVFLQRLAALIRQDVRASRNQHQADSTSSGDATLKKSQQQQHLEGDGALKITENSFTGGQAAGTSS